MMRPVGIDAVRAEIARACRDAGREADSVTLVAASKTFDADAIEPVVAAGQRVFGENRVQEARAKWPPLIARHPGLELHLVGPLQSNKAKDAVAMFDAIHSVDRESLAAALAKEIGRQGRRPLLFAEVNIGAESQKAGVAPQEIDAFLAACRARQVMKAASRRLVATTSMPSMLLPALLWRAVAFEIVLTIVSFTILPCGSF